jgi:hypothetical protein
MPNSRPASPPTLELTPPSPPESVSGSGESSPDLGQLPPSESDSELGSDIEEQSAEEEDRQPILDSFPGAGGGSWDAPGQAGETEDEDTERRRLRRRRVWGGGIHNNDEGNKGPFAVAWKIASAV